MATQRKVDLSSLDPQQVLEFKKSTDEEIQHFQSSLSVLQSATARLKECISNIERISSIDTSDSAQNNILVPLTSSLYVSGTIKDNDNFLVDVGTGYFIAKDSKDAIKVYQNKIVKLGQDSVKLKEIIQQKHETSQTLTNFLRSKMEK